MMIVTVPKSRGRGKKSWAKLVKSIAKNASSGRDWDGDWMTPDSEVDVDIGAMVVVGDADGEGAVVYVALPVLCWREDGVGIEDKFVEYVTDETKNWGSKLAVRSRKWLEMSIDDRLSAGTKMRREYLEECRERAEQNSAYKFAGANGDEARSRIDAIISVIDNGIPDRDPKMDALAKISQLMVDNGLSISDISQYRNEE